VHESDDSIPVIESPDAIEKLNTCMIRVAIAVAVMAGVPEPARAQDRPRVELAGGYQILKLQSEPLDAA